MGSMTSTPFPTERHLYYALARALNRGHTPTPDSPLSSAPSRPPLPVELVLDIFDLADTLETHPTESFTVLSRGECNILSFGQREEKLFFHSEPLSRHFLACVRQMRLHTLSRDQGWVSDLGGGSWSWFEVGILQPVGDTTSQEGLDIVELDFPIAEVPQDKQRGEDEGSDNEGTFWESEIDGRVASQEAGIQHEGESIAIQEDSVADVQEHQSAELEFNLLDELPTNEDASETFKYRVKYYPEDVDKPLRWKSHHNALASFSPTTQDGELFGPDHELWRYLKEGDVIAVYACALYPGWQNNARNGKLEFWEKFNPMGLEGGLKEGSHKEEH